MKLLLWLVLIWIGALWFMHLKKLKLAAARRAGKPAGDSTPKVTEAMLPCASCGVHLPRSEAILSLDGKHAWCCEEHRRLAPRSPSP